MVVDDSWVADLVEGEGEELLGWTCHRLRRLGALLVTVSAGKGYRRGEVGGKLARLRVLRPTRVLGPPGSSTPGAFAGYDLEGEMIVRQTSPFYWDPTAIDGVTAFFNVELWRYDSEAVGFARGQRVATLLAGVGFQAVVVGGDLCYPAGEVIPSFLWSLTTDSGVAVIPFEYYRNELDGKPYAVPAGWTGCETLPGIFGDAVDDLFWRVAILVRNTGMRGSLTISRVPIDTLMEFLGDAVRTGLEQWFELLCTCDGSGAEPPPGDLVDQGEFAGIYA